MHRDLRRKLSSASALIALATLAGCAGNGEGLDQNGQPVTPGGTAKALSATFDSIQDNVFTPVCTQCHAGANAPRGLRLDAGNSYALLVGVASSEVPALQRVKPGDPGSSYMIQKISGTAAVGARMPLDGPPYLPQATIDVISQWITLGAPKASSEAPGEEIALAKSFGLQIATSAPLNGDTVTTPLSQLVVGFDRYLDATLANATTVTLERLDDHAMINANLSVPLANPWALLVKTPEPLSDGVYRLVLRGSGGGALAGLDSRPLNSPTDSVVGKDSAIEFTVKVQQ